MEREIKFKAFDKETKKMHRVGLIDFDHKFCILETEGEAYFEKGFSQIELMQFTELTDKNGKEIYEGDFVYLSLFFHGETEINLISKGFIIWDGSKYIVKITESETDGRCLLYDKYDLSNFTNNDLEIISNIYEPPKLLKNETP